MPAHIYPKDDEMKDIPYSERLVYDYLSKLNDSFYIFHSVQWVKKITTRIIPGKKMTF